jgi:hypothetical protein
MDPPPGCYLLAMIPQVPPPAPPRRRPGLVGMIVGGALLVVALLVCGGGGALLAGPASRANQPNEAGVVGLATFQMRVGEDYWIFQPVLDSWPDSITCDVDSPADDSYTINRSARPGGAPAQVSDRDGRQYTYYGTLHGDQNYEVTLNCPMMEQTYMVVFNDSALTYLGVVLVAGTLAGLAGLVVFVISLVRRLRRRPAGAPPTAGAPVPPPAGWSAGWPPPPTTAPPTTPVPAQWTEPGQPTGPAQWTEPPPPPAGPPR